MRISLSTDKAAFSALFITAVPLLLSSLVSAVPCSPYDAMDPINKDTWWYYQNDFDGKDVRPQYMNWYRRDKFDHHVYVFNLHKEADWTTSIKVDSPNGDHRQFKVKIFHNGNVMSAFWATKGQACETNIKWDDIYKVALQERCYASVQECINDRASHP